VEVIKDILKGAGIGGFVTLVALGLSVRAGAGEPGASEGPSAIAPSAPAAAPQGEYDLASEHSRATRQGRFSSSGDAGPSDLATPGAAPRPVRPLPRLSGVPHSIMAGLDSEPFPATG
jgi:hypothetical protein